MDELKKARRRLADRIADIRVRMVPGLVEDLSAIMLAFDEIDRRTSVLAAVVLRKHFWPHGALPLHSVNALIAMGDEAEEQARRATHGDRCTCSACLPVGGAM